MVISRTPFRISFFGGGTDYPDWYEKNTGITISATINKYAFITLRKLPPFFDFNYRIHYFRREEVKRKNQIKHPVVREGLKFFNFNEGLEMVHYADLPARSGLGSSSTFTVGFIHALQVLQNKNVTKREIALNAIKIEQKIIKESVGSQDQTIASFGGFNIIEYSKAKTFQVQEIAIPEKRLKLLEKNLILCFTGFSRTAEKIAKSQIQAIPRKEKELFKMLNIANHAKKILYNNKISLDEFGKLLNEQWFIKKNLTKNISNTEIDEIYNTAIKSGAIGGKLLGAGGGGFMIFYAKPEKHKKIKDSLRKKLFVPFRFELTGSQIIYYSHE